jgi:hypothetical protein
MNPAAASRPARASAALLIGAAMSVSGCASHAQTAPVYREAAPAGSTKITVREEFDPARFREDLLLIQPLFIPPEVIAEPVPPTAKRVYSPASFPETDQDSQVTTAEVVYRVQVIALTRQQGAQQIADELARRFEVPADVLSQGNLYAVHAGHLVNAGAADSLRRQIAGLSRGYEGAFLVSDTLYTPTEVIVDDDILSADLPQAERLTEEPPTLEIDLPAFEPELVQGPGYRVLIIQFQDQQSAQEYRSRVMKRLKIDDVDVKFEAPYHKVLAGSFRTSTQAQKFVEHCRSLGYRSAARVPGEVFLPREEGENR